MEPEPEYFAGRKAQPTTQLLYDRWILEQWKHKISGHDWEFLGSIRDGKKLYQCRAMFCRAEKLDGL